MELYNLIVAITILVILSCGSAIHRRNASSRLAFESSNRRHFVMDDTSADKSIDRGPTGLPNGKFYFPADDEKGTMLKVNPGEPHNVPFRTEIFSSNKYQLYTRKNPTTPQPLIFNDSSGIIKSNINLNNTTVFIVHGWMGHGSLAWIKNLIKVFLKDDDVNVIVLDWSRLAMKVNYMSAMLAVPEVGQHLGEFIALMVKLGASYEKMHLIGFSFGAHIIGNAGRTTNRKIKRITGLDPAGPLWEADKYRISKDDAQYVEIIHTNVGFLRYGLKLPCGKADFYPNGGGHMPGCIFSRGSPCSHFRAHQYMIASVEFNKLLAQKCDTLRKAEDGECQGPAIYPMGNNDLNKSSSGIFRVNTGAHYPYAPVTKIDIFSLD